MKKFIYIPGFLDTGKSRNMRPSLDIWTKDYEPWEKLDCKYVIGHSLGANFALLNWAINKNTKLILTNPLLRREQITVWANRWLKYVLTGKEKLTESRRQTIKSHPLIEKRLLQLLTVDYWKILSLIPKNNIIIIRGEKDEHLCDKKTAQILKRKKIRILEVAGATHDWDDVASEAIKQIK